MHSSIWKKSMNFNKCDLVRIHWRDASSYEGWQLETDYKCKLAKCITVGYLIKNTKRKYVVINNIGNDQISGMVCIPKDWVIRVKYLKKVIK